LGIDKKNQKELNSDFAKARKQVSDYAMAFDLLANITQSGTEAETIHSIFQFCNLLFLPKKLFYVSLKDGQPDQIYSLFSMTEDDTAIKTRLSSFVETYAWTDSKQGFRIKIDYKGKAMGILEVDGIGFSQHREQYLNLTLSIADVCGLAIENAKRYQQIKDAERKIRQEKEKLEKAMSEIKILSGFLPICAHCKKIRDDKGYWNQIEEYITEHSEAQFSHSMCSECSDKLYGHDDWYIEMKNEKIQKE